MTHRMSLDELSEDFSGIVDRLSEGGVRIVLHRDGSDVAAVVSLRDLALLEQRLKELEDRSDLEEADRRLADPAESPVPYEQVREELGLR